MKANTPVWRWWRLLFTPLGLTTVAVGIFIALLLIGFGLSAQWLVIAAYAILVLATAAALRGGNREPGSWLGRRVVRRSLVAVQSANCVALLVSGLWSSPAGQAVLVVVLVLLDVALGWATQRVATAPDAALDERQEALRNHAHVLSYRLLGVVLIVILIAGVATPPTRWWLEHVVTLGGIAVFMQLLFGLPAMVLACIEPDRFAPESEARLRDSWAPISLALLALAVATPFVFSLTPVLFPARISASTSLPTYSPLNPAVIPNCREFLASADVGAGIGATIPLHAEACWDGRHAYEVWGMNRSDCLIEDSTLTTVTSARCARVTEPDGTLRFTYRATVSPTLLPFLVRDVDLSVVVDPHGHVERFP